MRNKRESRGYGHTFLTLSLLLCLVEVLMVCVCGSDVPRLRVTEGLIEEVSAKA